MICFPNCKINIGLYITKKRPDGYHNIETVFYPVPLCDILEIAENNKNEFTLSGLEISGGRESNLCLKAYDIVKKEYNLPPVKIHLHKAIPAGAGLGGGSSNAAFMIKLLNDIFTLNMTNAQMQDIAGNLGSDCSFFIEDKPVFATNKGDVFESINLDLSKYHLLLVKPDIHISTPSAYSMVKPRKAPFSLKNIDTTKITEWKNYITNDFEEPLFSKFPEIKMIKEKMIDLGAVYVSMSGSGSAVYGIFESHVETANLFDGFFMWQGKLE
ncbi:MAG: 4-(cytidine 5'-diphospho)-2-C-methyl-D-erythritol kinase [Bacteroidales bacterium]